MLPLSPAVALALALSAPACGGSRVGVEAEEDGGTRSAGPDAGDLGESDAPSGADADPDVAPVGRWQSFFNEPGPANNYGDNTLRNRLVTYTEGAVAGSEIRAHITRISSAPSMRVVVDALVDAHDRGVKIWMVHNGDTNSFPELEDRLGDRYVHCKTPEAENNAACLSNVDNGKHHMKNWYFSHVDLGTNIYKHLVLATSYNITVGQSRQFNDMLAVSGNEALYDAHVAVYDDYVHQRKTDDRYSEPGGRIFVPTAATYTAEFSPQKSGDMVADALEKIREYEPGCDLRVATLNLTRSGIIEQLVRIREMDCPVRVVTGTPLTEENESQLNEAGIPTRRVHLERNGHTISLHNKMMVYRGYYDTPVDAHPKSDRFWVWTGSQNYSAKPLRFRDDVFVGISRRGVYKNYSRHFEAIWYAAK